MKDQDEAQRVKRQDPSAARIAKCPVGHKERRFPPQAGLGGCGLQGKENASQPTAMNNSCLEETVNPMSLHRDSEIAKGR